MRPTCVLAADVVYDPSLISPFVDTLSFALERNKIYGGPQPFALVASTIRNPDTYSQFLQALEKRQLQWKLVDPKRSRWPHMDLDLFPSVHNQKMEGAVSILHIQTS